VKNIIRTFEQRDLASHLKLGASKEDVKVTFEAEYKDRLQKASEKEKANVHKRYKKKLAKLDTFVDKLNAKRTRYFIKAVNKLDARFDLKKYDLIKIDVYRHSKLAAVEGAKVKIYFGGNGQIVRIKVHCLKVNGIWKLAKARRYYVRKISEMK
jgi:hypothetical protein